MDPVVKPREFVREYFRDKPRELGSGGKWLCVNTQGEVMPGY
jgi:hypothetical protein